MAYTLPSFAIVNPSRTGGMGLNLRDAPARTGRRLATILDNSRVDVLGVARDGLDPSSATVWYRVRYLQWTGFCLSNFVSLTPDITVPLPATARVDPQMTGGQGLNLRDAPSRLGRWQATMRDNSLVQIVGAARERFEVAGRLWYQVQFGTLRGYCSGAFLALADGLEPGVPFVGAWPVTYPEHVVTARFNEQREYGLHEGVDLRTDVVNPPVVAWADGVVDKVFTWDGTLEGDNAYGNYVKVRHPSLSLLSMYCHLQSHSVAPGDALRAGDEIGRGDRTGNSPLAHLHFMLIDPINGLDGYVYPKVIDPTPHLPQPFTFKQ